jgi:hypothetical protein
VRSPAEMRKLLNRKIVEPDRICAICQEAFTDYSDVVPDHINPKGMGGAWRDDHPENIQATHSWCNEEKRFAATADRRSMNRTSLVTAEFYGFLQMIELLRSVMSGEEGRGEDRGFYLRFGD